jgi:parallel beta-helix repeat protein
MTFRRLAETARIMERGDKRAIAARAWLLMVACLVAGMSPQAGASDLCGTTILANLTLDHDLTCTGNGLIVGADGITINLNGHTITGPGSGVGISVPNRTGVLIVGGTVRNFLAGVQLVNSTAIVVKENRFTGNQDAVFLIGTSWSTVKENTAWQNTRVGVMLRPSGIRNSTQNVVVENTLTDNTNGIILVDTPTGNTIKENRISASSNAGINVNGAVSGNVIKENAFIGNAAGIRLNPGAGGLFPTDNRFIENTISMNTCGVMGPVGDNTFEENVLEGNVADLCF